MALINQHHIVPTALSTEYVIYDVNNKIVEYIKGAYMRSYIPLKKEKNIYIKNKKVECVLFTQFHFKCPVGDILVVGV